MAEGARLESVYTATYRGFESPPHRHILRRARTQVRAFFFRMWHPPGGMRTPDRGSTTGNASWTDREPASGLPRRGERSESIPPSPPYFKKSSYASTGFFFRMWHPPGGMRTPDRGSTTGAASWTDRARSKRAAPTKTPGAFLNNACVGPAGARPRDGPSNGERSESIPPHRHILRRARTQVRAFFSHVAPAGGDENPRPGFDEWQRHPDRTKKTNLMILSHFVLQGLVKQK